MSVSLEYVGAFWQSDFIIPILLGEVTHCQERLSMHNLATSLFGFVLFLFRETGKSYQEVCGLIPLPLVHHSLLSWH